MNTFLSSINRVLGLGIFLYLGSLSQALYAQEPAYILSVAQLSSPEYPEYEPLLNQIILQTFVQSKRFTIKDWTGIQEQFGASQNAYQDLQEQAGLTHVIIPELVQLGIEEKVLEREESSAMKYTCMLTVNMKIIDLASQTISVSEAISNKASETNEGQGPSKKIVQNAINYYQKDLDRFIDQYFPGTYPILEVLDMKKNQAHTLLLAAGSAEGIKKGDIFNIVQLKSYEVNGRSMTRKKQLGSAVITLVEGEHFSHCKIRSQDQDINSLISNGTQLCLVTKAKKGVGQSILKGSSSLNPFNP